MTVIVHNNRDETLTGNITLTGAVTLSADLRPTTGSGSTALGSSTQTCVLAVNDGSGNLIGYIKVFPWGAMVGSGGSRLAGSAVVS